MNMTLTNWVDFVWKSYIFCFVELFVSTNMHVGIVMLVHFQRECCQTHHLPDILDFDATFLSQQPPCSNFMILKCLVAFLISSWWRWQIEPLKRPLESIHLFSCTLITLKGSVMKYGSNFDVLLWLHIISIYILNFHICRRTKFALLDYLGVRLCTKQVSSHRTSIFVQMFDRIGCLFILFIHGIKLHEERNCSTFVWYRGRRNSNAVFFPLNSTMCANLVASNSSGAGRRIRYPLRSMPFRLLMTSSISGFNHLRAWVEVFGMQCWPCLMILMSFDKVGSSDVFVAMMLYPILLKISVVWSINSKLVRS